ncbi:hypothetical protein [Nocardia sp. NPDC051981]|uniref:hypothetical protein n=1 Tax=Nocardia sp. NPDC051981 TaxID=3155417 RepID=UPI0034284E85
MSLAVYYPHSTIAARVGHSPNRHVLIGKRTSLGTGPVSHEVVRFSLGPNGFSIDPIRADPILHKALTDGPDPLLLSMVFNISHEIAEWLLADGGVAESREPLDSGGEPTAIPCMRPSKGREFQLKSLQSD